MIITIPAPSNGTLSPLPVRGSPAVAAAASTVGPGVDGVPATVVVVTFVAVVGETSMVVVVGSDVDVDVLVDEVLVLDVDVLVLVDDVLVDDVLVLVVSPLAQCETVKMPALAPTGPKANAESSVAPSGEYTAHLMVLLFVWTTTPSTVPPGVNVACMSQSAALLPDGSGSTWFKTNNQPLELSGIGVSRSLLVVSQS